MRKKKEGFLRLIIIYKTVVGILEVLISAGLVHMLGKDLEQTFTNMALAVNLNIESPFVGKAIKEASSLHDSTYIGITLVLFSFGVLNIIEAWGLHMRQRWAEWLTVIATSLFIPLEVREIVKGITLLNAALLVMNVAIVYYLARHKELFKRAHKRREADL